MKGEANVAGEVSAEVSKSVAINVPQGNDNRDKRKSVPEVGRSLVGCQSVVSRLLVSRLLVGRRPLAASVVYGGNGKYVAEVGIQQKHPKIVLGEN